MEAREREIDLLDLFWKCLFEWRKVIACAIIFAIIVPIGMYGKNMMSYKKAMDEFSIPKETEEDINLRMSVLSMKEQQDIQSALDLQNRINELETYIKKAPIMSIVPYEAYRLSVYCYVDSGYTYNYTKDNKNDYTEAVLNAYSDYISDYGFIDDIFKGTGAEFDMKYANELISIEASGPIIEINVVYNDENLLEKVIPNIETKLNAATPNIINSIGDHKLVFLDESISKEVDPRIVEIQERRRNTLYNYRNQYVGISAGFSQEQKDIIESMLGIVYVKEDETEEEPIEPTKPNISMGFIIKYAVVGGVLGIFLMAGFIVVISLLSGKLQNNQELESYYRLRMLGRIPGSNELKGIDRVIYNIKNKNRKQLDIDAAMDIICSNIEIECKSRGISEIYLTGSYIEKVDESIVKRIISELSKLRIDAIYGENICYGAVSLRKMVETGAVVLVEQAGLSVYEEIDRELVAIKEHGTNLIGCVAIE